MKNSNNFIRDIRKEICDEIQIEKYSNEIYKIITPFLFDDGDNYNILLYVDVDRNKWIMTDNGECFLHLSYFIDLKKLKSDSRKELINKYLYMFNIEERNQVLISEVKDRDFSSSYYDLIQCMTHIMDIDYLTTERSYSTFKQDFKIELEKIIKENTQIQNVHFDYYLPDDKNHIYKIDCFIELSNLFLTIFAISTNDACSEAIMTTQWLIIKNKQFQSIGFYEDQSKITKKNIIRFADISAKTISSMDQIDKFQKYLAQTITP